MDKKTRRNVKEQKRRGKGWRSNLIPAGLVCICVCLAAILMGPGMILNASTGFEPLTEKFDLLNALGASITSGVGTVICLWVIFQWGMSFQSSDGGFMQAQALAKMGGALLMVMAPQIVIIFKG